MHVHEDCAEAFYVLSGEYIVFIEDDEVVCPAGSYVYVPQGMRHGFRVGAVQSRKLNLYAPGAMIGYFDALAAGVEAQDLPALADRFGMRVLGPVPEGYA